MFCNQCEQAAKGTGCTISGVCGKDPQVSDLQDLLVHQLLGIGYWAHLLHDLNVETSEANRFLIKGLFTTVTNVNFDTERLMGLLAHSQAVKEQVCQQLKTTWQTARGGVFTLPVPAIVSIIPESTPEAASRQAQDVERQLTAGLDPDIQSMRQLLLYGVKGAAAYADHALVLGWRDAAVLNTFATYLYMLCDTSLSLDAMIQTTMAFGIDNLKIMEALDHAHVEHFGHPVPTAVNLGVKKGPAILVSGHDLLDLEALLKQTEGKGITIYTHGEMLPAHGYPGLKKYAHLYGNYGGAWQDQAKEFDAFPGATLMTTNCIQRPRESYKANIFTTGLVAWPGVTHVADRNDFSVVINRALALGGFSEDQPDKTILVGFARNAVLSVADKVIEAVKAGQIKHFFLVGGCDGAKSGRNYYTEFAEKAPQDTVVLTLACGKFRFNKMEFGNIGGIPRLLDVGQCNDAYSAIQIAMALANAFECGVNDLPLSLVLSWYEQKAVCILITLLALGIKNIKLGPTLPAFVTPNVLNFLVANFNIQPTTTAEADLAEILSVKTA